MNQGSIFIVISISVFAVLLSVFFAFDGFFQAILDKLNYFITFLSMVTAGYSGYGLSRLSVFDKLDDIKEKDAASIYKQASKMRKVLESIIPFSLICAFILFFSGLLVGYIPEAYIFFSIFASFTAAGIVFLILIMTGIFQKISDLKALVMKLSYTEKKRMELVMKMREQAEKYPLSEMDFHLKKHKNIINS